MPIFCFLFWSVRLIKKQVTMLECGASSMYIYLWANPDFIGTSICICLHPYSVLFKWEDRVSVLHFPAVNNIHHLSCYSCTTFLKGFEDFGGPEFALDDLNPVCWKVSNFVEPLQFCRVMHHILVMKYLYCVNEDIFQTSLDIRLHC